MANPTPFYEDPEYKRRVELLLGTPQAPVAPVGAPPPPVPEQPRVDDARVNLQQKKLEQFQQEFGPGPTAGRATADWMAKNAPAATAVIPNTTNAVGGFREGMAALGALGSALMPQVARRDDRPLSVDERAEFTRPQTMLEGATGTVPGEAVAERVTREDVADPTALQRAATVGKGLVGLSAKEALEGYAADAVAMFRDQPRPQAEGLPLENGTLYWMRLLGTAAAAPIQEALLRAPVGVQLGKAEDGSPTVDGVETFSEFLLGTDVGHGQKVRHENPLADYIQGVAERIETGSGLETDFQAGFRERFGPEWANVGWYVGLPMDVLMNWEAPIKAGASGAGRLIDAMDAVKELAPEATGLQRLVAAVRESTANLGERVAGKVVAGVERGEFGPEQLPDSVRPYVEAVASSRTGQSLEELHRVNGAPPAGPLTTDPIQVAADTEREAARKAVAAGNVEGVAAGESARAEAVAKTAADRKAALDTIMAETDVATKKLAAEVVDAEERLAGDQAKVFERLQEVHDEGAAALADAGEKKVKDLAAKFEAKVVERKKLVEAADSKPLRKRLAALTKRKKLKEEEAKELLGLPKQIDKVDAEQAKHLSALEAEQVKHREALAKVKTDTDAKLQKLAERLAASQEDARNGPRWVERRKDLDAKRSRISARIDEVRQKAGERAARVEERTITAYGKTAKVGEGVRPSVPQVSSDGQFFDQVARQLAEAREKGTSAHIRFERGDGAARIRGITEQTPDLPMYRLVSEAGEVKASGPLEQVAKVMALRSQQGDVIRWMDQRAVAEWGKSGRIERSFLFSTDLEERVLASAPGPARRLRAMDTSEGLERAAGNVLADLVTRGQRLPASRPTTELGEVYAEGIRLWATDRTGARDLAVLPNMSVVTKADRARILAEADRSLGVSPKRWVELVEGAKPTDKETLAIRQAALAAGLPDMADAPTSAPFYRALRNAVVEHIGGAVADTKMRIRGLPAFHDRLLQNLAVMSADAKKLDGIMGYIQRSGLASGFVRFFMEDRLAGLPPATRLRMNQLRTELELAGDEVAKLIREVAGEGRGWLTSSKDAAARLRELLPQFSPVTEDDLRLLDQVTAELQQDGADVDGLARRILLADRPAKGVSAWLGSSDEVMQRFGIEKWAKETERRAAASAKQYLVALTDLAAKKAEVGNLSRQAIDGMSLESLRRIYDEVFVFGRPLGPKVRQVLGDLVGREAVADVREEVAIGAWLVRARLDGAVQTAMEDLVEAGAAVKGTDARVLRGVTDRVDLLTAVSNGTHRFGDEVLFPSGAVAWADHTLRGWGMVPGHAGQLSDLRLPSGHHIIVPKYLEEEVGRLVNAGKVGAQKKVDVVWAAHEALRVVKAINLAGYGPLVNFGYFASQFFSVWPTLATSRGVLETAALAPRILGGIASGIEGAAARAVGKQPRFLHRVSAVGELMARLNAPPGAPVYAALDPSQRFIKGADGTIHTIEEAVAGARAGGLADTITSFESANHLAEAIRLEALGTLNPLRAWSRWNETLRDFAGVVDQAARSAVYLDELARGVPMPQAAATAKAAALDFRAMAPEEAKFARMVIMFYAFERANLNLFVRTAIEHPERLAMQARLAHKSYTSNHYSKLLMGMQRDNDPSRWVLAQDENVVGESGQFDPRYQSNAWTTSPMGVGEQLAEARLLLEMVSDPGDAAVKVEDKFTPFMGLLTVWGGISPKLDDDRSNRVPPWMMNLPVAGDRLIQFFGVGPLALEPDENTLLEDPDATLQNGEHPSVWTIGSSNLLNEAEKKAARQKWQTLMLVAGRPLSRDGSVQQQLRAVGLEATRPTMTQGEETLSGLLGIRVVPIPTPQEAESRALLRRQAGYQRETSAVEAGTPTR